MSKNNEKLHNREVKSRMTFQQKKIRRQQVFISVVGIILVLAMVLALVAQY
jgi:hypothetical protein